MAEIAAAEPRLPVLPTRVRLRDVGAVLAAFVRRDFATARSYRLPFAMELGQSVFMLALFYFLARVVDRGDVADLAGMERGYFPFVVVGIAVFRTVQTSMLAFARRLRQEQTTGTLEALLATPAPTSLVILGSSAYDLIVSVAGAVGILGVAALMGLRFSVTAASVGVAVVATLAAVALFAGLGIAIGAFGLVFKQAEPLVGMVSAAFMLLGGVYFPTSVLPAGVRGIADAIPFTWTVDLLRGALLGASVDGPKLATLVVSGLVWLAFGVRLFAFAVTRARRSGSLGQY